MYLKQVTDEDRELLWNINQKYLYEMTHFYDDPMDEAGNYHYGFFDEYFIDPKRQAWLFYEGDQLVGFAFMHPYSQLHEHVEWVLAEFTIFPHFRGRHLAYEAINLLLASHPGRWEIKYNEKNHPAKKLWHQVTAPYHPQIIHLNEWETVFAFTYEKEGD